MPVAVLAQELIYSSHYIHHSLVNHLTFGTWDLRMLFAFDVMVFHLWLLLISLLMYYFVVFNYCYRVSHSLPNPAMKLLQQNLDRRTFVVWEIKRNVSVVCVSVVCLIVATRSSSILISGKIIKEMLGSVVSGTHCSICHSCSSSQWLQ